MASKGLFLPVGYLALQPPAYSFWPLGYLGINLIQTAVELEGTQFEFLI